MGKNRKKPTVPQFSDPYAGRNSRRSVRRKATPATPEKLPKPPEGYGQDEAECWRMNLASLADPEAFLRKNEFYFRTLCDLYGAYVRTMEAAKKADASSKDSRDLLRSAVAIFDKMTDLGAKLKLIEKAQTVKPPRSKKGQGEAAAAAAMDGPEAEYLT